MTRAARISALIFAVCLGPAGWLADQIRSMQNRRLAAIGLICLTLFLAPMRTSAQSDCFACHADKTMQNSTGHSISVDGDKFSSSIHGSLQCNNCHADIKEF